MRDVVPATMENLLAKHGLEKDASIKHYTDYRVLEENNVTLVSIVQDLNFVIEKHMTMSMADTEEIIRRSEERV